MVCTYNGLGLRVGKTDSTGSYTYVCDGASPGADVLSDGHALYTPGLSENRNGTSSYYSSDLLGNLWTVDGSGKSQTGYEDTTGFGTLTALAGIGGAGGTPFGYGGGNGCQTDADTGLILMGHRYYDTRIGRFISQDPAGDGDNWYPYADNSPTNETDPTGLWVPIAVEGDQYVLDRVSAMAAFANEGLSLSANLDNRYKFYNVYKITYYASTGNIISNVYQFSFGIPIGADLNQNYGQALADRRIDAPFNIPKTYAYFMRSQGNGMGKKTTGDYKDQPHPAGLTGRQKIRLHYLLDNGGNFNGGIVAEGYGTWGWENPLLGAVAKSISDKQFESDDAQGQRVFNEGWEYGNHNDPSVGGYNTGSGMFDGMFH